MQPLRLGLGILLAALLAAWAAGSGAAQDEEAQPRSAVDLALQALDSPAERTRRDGVARLTGLLPASRDPVVRALPDADAVRRPLLVEVLVRDASSAGIRAVLQEMRTREGIEATELLQILIRDRRACDQVLEVWRRHPGLRRDLRGRISPQARIVEEMIRRAEAERLFLSRKSKSGSTGSYHGQYELLEPYREEALDLCQAIIRDRALPTPGVYASGVFEFIRPPSTPIDLDELRGMAAHAFSELATATDRVRIAEMDAFLAILEERMNTYSYGANTVKFYEAVSRFCDLLVALYLADEPRYARRLEGFLDDLNSFSWRRTLPDSYWALVQLRVGRYAEAVEGLERILDSIHRGSNEGSAAATHYNLACAYARWGEQAAGLRRENRYAHALMHLTRAVRNQWSDIGWMEEDRDLEPIRDTARYRLLVKEMRAANRPDDD